eukprot:766832-Hanusia_phi.AAC.1
MQHEPISRSALGWEEKRAGGARSRRFEKECSCFQARSILRHSHTEVSRPLSRACSTCRRSKTVAGFHGEPKEEAGARRMSGGEFHELDYTKHVREMLERSGRMLEINEENQQRRLREQPAGIDEYKVDHDLVLHR